MPFAFAAGSGLLLALSFPKYGNPAFAWVAISPLVVAVQGSRTLRAFWLGLVSGLIYFTGTIYWATEVMAVYGGLDSRVALLVNGLLIAYLSLFPAIFAAIVARVSRAVGVRGLVVAPFAWVATEFGRSYLMTGFPWVLLGYSQAPMLPIAQVASVVGVFGLSLLVASVGAALAYPAADVLVGTSASRGRGPTAYAPVVGLVVLVLLVGLWGSRRISRGELTTQGDPVSVGLVQGNVAQSDKWDPTRAVGIFREYLEMTRRAVGQGAQLVLWPESSTPFFFQEDKPGAEQVRAIAREARVPILVGSDQVEPGPPAKYFNAAFLVRPDGSDGGTYRKMHLVPFGEYVPLKSLLFFAAPLVEKVSDFSPGESIVLLPARGHQLSTAICYEIVYPDLVRHAVDAGSALLTTITNDAWFGRTSAPYQHFVQASLRAIENGRYLVRAANTGVSGIVDPYGRVVSQSAIFEPAVIVGQARFLTTRTVYGRIGDLAAYISLLVTVLAVAYAQRRVQ